jgi:prenyltransferase beta subunit
MSFTRDRICDETRSGIDSKRLPERPVVQHRRTRAFHLAATPWAACSTFSDMAFAFGPPNADHRSTLRRPIVTALLLGVLLSTPFEVGRAAPPVPRSVETSGLELVTPQTQKAIDNGLAWLATRQQPDGSFGTGGGYRRNVAVTSLCGMAFLSAGHTPGRGKYGGVVEKALQFVLRSAKPDGYINASEEYHGPMYGHGFATLFLAEVYGMSPRKDVREKLQKAVELIVATQNKEGGWRYDPRPTEADVSVTVCQIMALRAARNAGIFVPKDTVDRCTEYVKRCQNADGGFRYQLNRNHESLFPRSAAAVVALYSAGIYQGREIERGLNYLMHFLPRRDPHRYDSHYFYAQYYAVQAMWHAGDQYWYRWYPAIRDELLARQMPGGSWTDAPVGNEYGTGMALIVLQMPNNYLPIFQR